MFILYVGFDILMDVVRGNQTIPANVPIVTDGTF